MYNFQTKRGRNYNMKGKTNKQINRELCRKYK